MSYIFWFALENSFAEPLVIASFAMSIAIVALSFMASEFFSMPAIKAFGKNELREIGVTAVIMVIVIGLAARGGPYDKIAAGMSPAVAQGGTPNVCDTWLAAHGPYRASDQAFEKGSYAFGTASYFIGCRFGFSGVLDLMTGGASGAVTGGRVQGVLLPELMGFYREFMMYEIMTGLASTFSIGIEMPPVLMSYFPIDLHVQGIIPFIFLNPINESHTLLVDTIGTLISATAAQNMLLEFVEVNVPLVMLPIGIFLRAFPFSRKAGSTVIAFAFVAYYIYPLTILLNQKIYEDISVTKCQPGSILKHDGESCNTDLDCCSQNCVSHALENAAGTTVFGKKCYPMLGDFRKFQSTFAYAQKGLEATQINDAATQAAIEAQLKADQDKELEYQKKMEALKDPTAPSTKPNERERQLLEKQQKEREALDERAAGGQNSVFMSPSTASNLLNIYELYVSEAARLLVLNSLFIVTEILLTLTLLKDISILIGGEPKLLGISKLV